MSNYIEELSQAITAMHECGCSHFGTEQVKEEHDGVGIWEGPVEVFQLTDHPEAKIAYGWGWEDDTGEIQYIGILKAKHIESASDAVKAAIASGQFS